MLLKCQKKLLACMIFVRKIQRSQLRILDTVSTFIRTVKVYCLITVPYIK